MSFLFNRFCISVLSVFIFLGGLSCTATGQPDDDDYRERAIRILEEVPLIDGHNDVAWQYHTRVEHKFSEMDLMNTSDIEPPVHTDIQRLREGRVGGQFWSVYVSPNQPESQAVQQTMEQIDFVHRMIQRYPDHFELALTADDVERVFADGKIASMIGMEGGNSIGNSLAVLRQFYDLGARYLTITHSRTLDWADSSTDDPVHDGLSGFGDEVIREMNRLGMLVDLSHVSSQTMRDALDVTEAPVIFSHSSAKAVSRHARNVPDDVLHRLKENNGVIMITYVPSFVSEELRLYYAERNAYRAEVETLHPDQPEERNRKIREWQAENPQPRATLEQVADHIDHVRDEIGVDYLGIGADYDGITTLPDGLEDVSTYPDLFAELLRRGYSEEDLKKIAGLNVLRVMREAEEVSRLLQDEREPSEVLIGDLD